MPAGVDDGQTLRLAGKGESVAGRHDRSSLRRAARAGRRAVQRDGDDILTEVPVSFVKAALGGEVEIYTLEDNCNGSATIELKPGTQPGDVIVRRGQGIPRVGEHGRGDHVIQFKVEIPKKLTARQEELLRELATELGEDGVRAEKRGLFGRKK